MHHLYEMHTLREILCRKNSVEELTRAFSVGGTADELRSHFIPHVAAVLQRVEVAAGDEHARLWSVKLTALVHEIPPTELVATLQSAGMADVASRILAIVNGFGQVWKIQTQEEMQSYVNAHRADLAALLLFEVAHEGAATEAMRAVAALGGLRERIEKWSAHLATVYARNADSAVQ